MKLEIISTGVISSTVGEGSKGGHRDSFKRKELMEGRLERERERESCKNAVRLSRKIEGKYTQFMSWARNLSMNWSKFLFNL